MSGPQIESSGAGQRSSPLLARLHAHWHWIAVAALSVLALWIRVFPRFYLVFQPGFVNFQEIDAWYHLRVAENLIRHFPWRIPVDPYLEFGHVQDTATAPTFDWLLGFIAWIAGAGSPSESLLHNIAAWYPVVLASFTVVAVFLLGRLLFGQRAALVAAAIIAVLPGHFFRVSSLGFTDHHIMESLLATLSFYLLLRALQRPDSIWRALTAGLVLSAYLLTFHGSALLAGIVVGWAIYDRLRSLWPRSQPAPATRPLYIAFLTALCICLIFHHLLWMNFTIAALGLGCLLIGVAELWVRWQRRYQGARLVLLVLVGATLLATGVTIYTAPFVRHIAKLIAQRLMPGLFGAAGGVNELQSLIFQNGHYTLQPEFLQFYGAFVFALLGLCALAAFSLKHGDSGKALIFFWSLTTCILSIGQLRMTYYYAVCVAILTAYFADAFLASGRKTAWATIAILVLSVFAPSLYADLNSDEPTGISPNWREALDWMRASTPEPFSDPDFYYARYSRQQFGPDYRYPPTAYSVMAWWDYGYWIIDVARRVPVTNPTQKSADVAADFFLAQSEADATAILRAWRTRYVVLDEALPLWPNKDALVGDYPSFFEYSRKYRSDDYLLRAAVPDVQGKLKPKVFYLPGYYRSVVVRLFVFGGEAVEARGGSVLLTLREEKLPNGRTYRVVVDSRRYESATEALAAEAACKQQGCVLVGDNPMISCVSLDALHDFRPVFASGSSVVWFGSSGRRAVQVYEFTGAAR